MENYARNLPILDGKNYKKWCIQVRVIFGFQKVMDIVNPGTKIWEKIQLKNRSQHIDRQRMWL